MSAIMTAAPLPAPLPCPFCGTPPIVTDHNARDDETGETVVDTIVECRCGGGAIAFVGAKRDAIAAWNRRAPEAQAWRAPPEKAPNEVIVAASEAGRRAFEIAKTLTINPSERQQTAGHAIVHYAYLAGWRDAHPLPAPPGATPAAPPAREAALVEALREALREIAKRADDYPDPDNPPWSGPTGHETISKQSSDMYSFDEGLTRGRYEMAVLARAALAEAEGRAE